MTQEIASLFARVGADVGDYNKGMKGVKDDLSSTQKGFASFQDVVTTGFKAIGVAAVAAFAVVGAGVVSAIKAAADFEQGVTDIGAVMNLTGDEAVKLQDHIMDLGLSPDLKVSATEASDAIMSLGTAGLSLNQIMDGASESTVQLSNATGGPMADSAALITDIMSQFNITAEESGRIVDQVTGLTVASKFAFGDAALAISQAGGVAGATGVSFEDFNAILGVTAANFSSGSDAGTSLKTFLTTLIPKSQEAEDVMASLGLVTTDYARFAEYLSGVLGTQVEPSINGVYEAFKKTTAGAEAAAKSDEALGKAFTGLKAQYQENQFFDDTTGKMKSGAEIAGVLQTAFGGLSEEQRLNAASTIFGNDAMRTAFGLIDAGTPGITAMKEEIAKVDAGSIAAKRMDTFAGAMEIAQGIIETLSISVGQKFLPVLRPLVEKFSELAQKYGPMVVDWFGEVAEKISQFIGNFLGVAPVVEEGTAAVTSGTDAMAAAFGALSNSAGQAKDVFVQFKGALTGNQEVIEKMTGTTGGAVQTFWKVVEVIQNVISTIKTVTGLVMQSIKPITDAIGKWVGWQDILLAVGVLLGGVVLAAIGGFIAAMAPVILLVAKVTLVIAALREAWEHNFLGIRDITEDVLDRIGGWLQTYTGVWKGSWDKTLKFFVEHSHEAWGNLVESVKNFVGNMVNETRHRISVWAEDIDYWFRYFTVNGKMYLHTWYGWVVKYFTDAKEWAVDMLEKWFGWFKPNEWLEKGKDIIQGLWDGAKEVWNGFANWWRGLWRTLTGTVDVQMKIGSPSKEMFERGAWAIEGFAKGAQSAMPMVYDAMSSLANISMGSAEPSYAYAGGYGGSTAGSSEDDALMRENNQLLRALIAALQAKNMTANVTVAGGGGGNGLNTLVTSTNGLRG